MAGAGERRLSGLRSSVVSQKPSHVLENESEKIIRVINTGDSQISRVTFEFYHPNQYFP
jgi:hypothetical protein